MNAKQHYEIAEASLAQLPEETAESFEQHAEHVELMTVAGVHALLAVADLLDDLVKSLNRLMKS